MYVKTSFILLAVTGVRKNSTVACGFIPVKIHYFDYPKRFINRINGDYDFSINYSDILFKKNVKLQKSIRPCIHVTQGLLTTFDII